MTNRAKIFRWSMRAAVVTGLAVGVAALFIVSSNASVIAVAEPHVHDTEELSKAPVAIVLGAGLFRGKPGAVLADRLEQALEHYRAGRVEHILVSGDNDGRGHDEVNPMREWLMHRGVPSDAIYMDHAGFRTLDTMRRARDVFGVERAIICTQDFHLHRSIYLARSFGIDASGAAAPSRRWRTSRGAQVRELAARAWAFLDVTVGRNPRYLGEQIPIGRVAAAETHDRNTLAR